MSETNLSPEKSFKIINEFDYNSEKNKVKEYLECISVSYLLNNVAELRHSDKISTIRNG